MGFFKVGIETGRKGRLQKSNSSSEPENVLHIGETLVQSSS